MVDIHKTRSLTCERDYVRVYMILADGTNAPRRHSCRAGVVGAPRRQQATASGSNGNNNDCSSPSQLSLIIFYYDEIIFLLNFASERLSQRRGIHMTVEWKSN